MFDMANNPWICDTRGDSYVVDDAKQNYLMCANQNVDQNVDHALHPCVQGFFNKAGRSSSQQNLKITTTLIIFSSSTEV